MQTHEFTVPLSLAECIERLLRRHEGATIFALPMQHRTDIQLTPVDSTTYRFVMQRVGARDWFTWNTLIQMRGYLRSVDDHSTYVEARVYPSPKSFGIVLGILAVLVYVLFMVSLSESNISTLDALLRFGQLSLIFSVVAGVLWFVLKLLQSDLMYTLEKTLRK